MNPTKERVYLDNAATTDLRPEVRELMHDKLDSLYGNPSAMYEQGRNSKTEIERARKAVAENLGAKPSEIFFTSGGTESTNTALWSYVVNKDIKKIVTSPIEHHATHSTAKFLAEKFDLELIYVELDELGRVIYDSIREAVSEEVPTLISLMHANNEVGNLTDPKILSEIAAPEHVKLHMVLVQTIGHYPIDFSSLGVDVASGSSHKYHGPKGVGILYVREGSGFKPLVMGGAQERNMRAGTENLYGILGLSKALELSMQNIESEKDTISNLKKYTIEQVKSELPDAVFHGDPEGDSLYTVVNIGLPKSDKTEMLLMHLDMQGYCLSGGSACSSGVQSSHVIGGIYGQDHPYTPLRISFCKDSKKEHVDGLVSEIKAFL